MSGFFFNLLQTHQIQKYYAELSLLGLVKFISVVPHEILKIAISVPDSMKVSRNDLKDNHQLNVKNKDS